MHARLKSHSLHTGSYETKITKRTDIQLIFSSWTKELSSNCPSTIRIITRERTRKITKMILLLFRTYLWWNSACWTPVFFYKHSLYRIHFTFNDNTQALAWICKYFVWLLVGTAVLELSDACVSLGNARHVYGRTGAWRLRAQRTRATRPCAACVTLQSHRAPGAFRSM